MAVVRVGVFPEPLVPTQAIIWHSKGPQDGEADRGELETGANLRVAMDKWSNERRKSRFMHDIPWNQSGLTPWKPGWTRLPAGI